MLQPNLRSSNRIGKWLLKLRGNERAINTAKQLVDQGDRDRAMSFLARSTEVFSSCNELKAEAASFLFAQGDYSSALQWLLKGGIQHVTEPTLFQWASRIEEEGDHRLAIELLKLNLSPAGRPANHDPSETHYRIARLYRILGDTESTIEHVALCLKSGNYENVLSMLCSLNSEHESKLLLSHVDEIKRVVPLPGHYSIRLNFAISDIYRHNHDYRNSAIHLGLARDEFIWKGKPLLEGEPVKPSFLVIGSMKCGTTGFYHTLCEHPHVYRSVRKEVRYFSDRNATDQWYFAHFPRLPKGHPGITGEATPNYFALNIHDRIEKTLPGVKLIWLMRDPARRAISQFFHGYRYGAIKRPIEQFFDEATLNKLAGKSDAEIEEIAFRTGEGNREYNHSVVLGMYVYFLRKWIRKFGASRLLLLTLEEFSCDQDRTIARTCEFLGLEKPDQLNLTKPNRGVYEFDDDSVQRVLPRLQEFYKTHNQKLFDEFGIQFNPTPDTSKA